jgi:hypothetical protein
MQPSLQARYEEALVCPMLQVLVTGAQRAAADILSHMARTLSSVTNCENIQCEALAIASRDSTSSGSSRSVSCSQLPPWIPFASVAMSASRYHGAPQCAIAPAWLCTLRVCVAGGICRGRPQHLSVYRPSRLAVRRPTFRIKIRSDKIVGFHDATRLATLHNSAMPGPLTPRHKGTVYWR